MQVPGSFSKRIVVISGGGSAASALPQTPNPPRPAAPASAALVRNRRRLCAIGIKTSPFSPHGWIAKLVGRATVFQGRSYAGDRLRHNMDCLIEFEACGRYSGDITV